MILKRVSVVAFAVLMGIVSLVGPASAGAGTHVIYSSKYSDTPFAVKWQKDSGSYYDDSLSVGERDQEDDAAHPNAEPYSFRLMPGKKARWAVNGGPYGSWSYNRGSTAQWWTIHPGDGYASNWVVTVQYVYI